MSIFTSRWSIKAAALKTLGAAAALAVGASTLVVSPAQAVSDDFEVWHYPADYDSAYVCADPSSGDSLSFLGTTTVDVDFDESSSYYDINDDQVDFTPVSNSYCGGGDRIAYRADNLEPDEEVYFAVYNTLIETSTVDVPGEGSSYWDGSNGDWYSNRYRTDASLAYEVDYIHDERHTAVICVEPYNNDGDHDWLVNYNIEAYNITDDAWEDLDWFSEDPYDTWYYGDGYQCSNSDDIEFYVTGLTLGDTYQFNITGVNEYWVWDGGWYIDDTYWVSEWTNYFTPLNVHSEQRSLFDDNNGGCDGSCEASDDDYGTDEQQAHVWVDTPVYADGWNFNSADAWWYLEDRDGDEWDNGWLRAWQVGNEYYDNTFSWMSGMDGQAFVEASYCDCDWTFEGLSDTYIDNMDLDWNHEWVRALTPNSVEMTIETNMTTDEWNSDEMGNTYDTNQYLDPSTATYYIRAIPNDGGRDYWDDGSYDYSGNDTDRPTRYETINYVFVPEDEAGEEDLTYDTLGDVDGYWNGWRTVYYDQGAVRFVLNGLQPGTTYDIEYRAVVPVDGAEEPWEGDLMDSYWDDANGDGNYTEVEYRDSVAWFTTTYLDTKVDQVTDTSARFLINVTDSHMNTTNLQKDAINGFYWSINECQEESGYWDGSEWIDGGFVTCNEIDNSDSESRFDSDHTTATKVSTDQQDLIKMGDGQMYVPVVVEGLKPNTQYEMVAGFDYWFVNGVETDSWWWEDDYSYEFSETLDYSTCGWDVIDFDDTDFGTDCYNGTWNNEIFRTDVRSFVTSGEPTLEAFETDLVLDEEDVPTEFTYIDTDLTFHFNKDVAKGDGAIEIRKADGTLARSIDVHSSAVTIDGHDVTVVLSDNLAYGTTYYVVLQRGVFTDIPADPKAAPAPLAEVDTAEFTTEDQNAPTVVSVSVVDGEEDGTDTDTAIAITFSENIVKGDAPIELRRKSDDTIVRTIVPSASQNVAIVGDMAVISSTTLLAYHTEYYLHISAGSFKDVDGNAVAEWSDFSFMTEAQPAHLGTVTAGASYNNGTREIKLNFGSDMAGQVVRLVWVSRHTDKNRDIRNVTLDANGDATVTVSLFRLEKRDGLRVMFGRHAIAWHTIKVD